MKVRDIHRKLNWPPVHDVELSCRTRNISVTHRRDDSSSQASWTRPGITSAANKCGHILRTAARFPEVPCGAAYLRLITCSALRTPCAHAWCVLVCERAQTGQVLVRHVRPRLAFTLHSPTSQVQCHFLAHIDSSDIYARPSPSPQVHA